VLVDLGARVSPEQSGPFVFGVKMNQQITSTASGSNGESTTHDLFALTDEQILEIEPEAQGGESSNGHPPASGHEPPHVAPVNPESRRASLPVGSDAARQDANRRLEAGATQTLPSTASVEPPPWLAAQMKDPWSGEEAKELWNGVQQAKSEAAAYRAAFANPEDARALKELYPGGVNEARAASERARVLDDIDRAYFGAAGKSAQEVSATREQLAQQMMREDPAAFREMVFAGLRALETSGVQANGGASAGSRFSATSPTEITATQTTSNATHNQGGLKSAPTNAPAPAETQAADDARLAAYVSFEKAANDDLERSVGGAIDRTLAQALPNASRVANASGVGAQHAAPLQARLSQAIRQDVEAALKGDRQLGEQVAQILSGRRLDDEVRAQVVRLIGERAQQLVPVAAKRVLNDWTQATLATHRGNSVRAGATSARTEVAPASPPAGPPANSNRAQTQTPNRSAAPSDPRRVDYRKLSDEQILDL
jgi:hypothetical protein